MGIRLSQPNLYKLGKFPLASISGQKRALSGVSNSDDLLQSYFLKLLDRGRAGGIPPRAKFNLRISCESHYSYSIEDYDERLQAIRSVAGGNRSDLLLLFA